MPKKKLNWPVRTASYDVEHDIHAICPYSITIL